MLIMEQHPVECWLIVASSSSYTLTICSVPYVCLENVMFLDTNPQSNVYVDIVMHLYSIDSYVDAIIY